MPSVSLFFLLFLEITPAFSGLPADPTYKPGGVKKGVAEVDTEFSA